MTAVILTPAEDGHLGFLRVPDAVRMGYLDGGDPAAPALQQLLAGADPWCPFFF